MSGRLRALVFLPALAGLVLVFGVAGSASGAPDPGARLAGIDHIVVIYEENHSFDNLYGGWEGVNGISGPGYAEHASQVGKNGVALPCLLQLDVNLTTPPLSKVCGGVDKTAKPFDSHFPNAPFEIDASIPASATSCPPPSMFAANGVPIGKGLPGGCTRDVVHRFYQEQFQIDGGKQDQYVLGSDAGGLTMGYYDTKHLPIYEYLHHGGHPHYAIEDDFFQGAFGGSFLNHQFLVAATAPPYNGAVPTGLRSVVDTRGFPNAGYPFYATSGVADGAVTATCASLPASVSGLGCGNFAVNTIQPTYWPYSSPTAAKLPPLTNPTIGDLLSGAGIDWAWYSGGWSNADGDQGAPGWTNGSRPTCSDPNANPANSSFPRCPDYLFQYHHQPFDYYANFDPSTPAGRANRTAHLQDEQAFIDAAQASTKHCQLKPVSFVKPLGEENEHPGYASEPNGSDHLVSLLKDVENGACAKDTMVVVTYDEFGGQWDHVSPPGQGNDHGAHDQWGPGTRIPTLVVSPKLRGNFVVDSTEHDTTSILATIENRFLDGERLGTTTRDGEVADLSSVYTAKQVGH